MRKFTQTQRGLLLHWLRMVLIAEIILFLFRDRLIPVLFLFAILFFIGLSLRILKLYPGKPEPLILDSSAVVISLLIAFGYNIFLISSAFVMAATPVIILPHIIYIIRLEI